MRDWYAAQIAHFSPDGVDFWWNDEGETLYYTFYWWNVAQVASLAAFDPKKRFFTINRSAQCSSISVVRISFQNLFLLSCSLFVVVGSPVFE